MAEWKRYYWLKLQDGFFQSKRIKKLRKIAGGDTYTIIYLKMQLIAMKHDGILTFSGLEQNFAEELALDLDEEPDNVSVTVNYLISCGLMETSDDVEYFLPYAVENVGSEGASAKRVREYRERQEGAKPLQSNADVTQVKRLSNGEIEKRRDREELDKSKSRFTPPTIAEVTEYCKERGNQVDPQHFIDYYEARGWMLKKDKMKDWKAAVRTWERNNFNDGKQSVYGNAAKGTDECKSKWNLHHD